MTLAVYPGAIWGLKYEVVKTPEFSTIVQPAPGLVPQTRIAQAANPLWHWQLYYEQLFNSLAANPNLTETELETLMGFFLSNKAQFGAFLFDDPEDDVVTDQVQQLVADTSNPVSAAAVGASAGTGFLVGDYLAVIGGGGTAAILSVASVGGGGAITGFNIVNGGTGYATTTGAALTVLTGAGTGAPTANITATTVYYTPLQRNMAGVFFEDVTDLNPVSGSGLAVEANGVAQTQAAGNVCSGGGDFELHGPGLAIPGFSFAGMYLKWCAAPTPPITASFNFYFRVRFEKDTQDFEKFLQRLWTIGGTEGQRSSGVVKICSAGTPGS
jgi:hypothetical protein